MREEKEKTTEEISQEKDVEGGKKSKAKLEKETHACT